MTVYLALDDFVTLIEDLGVGPVRDWGLLEAAAHRPATTVWGADAYLEIDDKAAALLESLVRNHALVDGNKRLGWLSVTVFYGLNGWQLDAPEDPAYDLVVSMAEGAARLSECAQTLAAWRRPLDFGG